MLWLCAVPVCKPSVSPRGCMTRDHGARSDLHVGSIRWRGTALFPAEHPAARPARTPYPAARQEGPWMEANTERILELQLPRLRQLTQNSGRRLLRHSEARTPRRFCPGDCANHAPMHSDMAIHAVWRISSDALTGRRARLCVSQLATSIERGFRPAGVRTRHDHTAGSFLHCTAS